MKTKLINYRVYNLEAKDADKSKVIPIDRRSIFGNPYVLNRDGNRKEVIKAYKEWFDIRIYIDPTFKEAVETLVGKTLGCWCTPLPCHGDVIIEYLEGLE